MTNKSYNDFLDKVVKYESSGRWEIENEYGFLGAFQMGEEALEDAGYYKRNRKHPKMMMKIIGMASGQA